jgi:hypothetical protein
VDSFITHLLVPDRRAFELVMSNNALRRFRGSVEDVPAAARFLVDTGERATEASAELESPLGCDSDTVSRLSAEV